VARHTEIGRGAVRRPRAHIAKAFNTVFGAVQADTTTHGTILDALCATDDNVAAATMSQLASSIGFRPVHVGPLAASRELEAIAWLNIRLQMIDGGDWRTAVVLVGAPAASLAASSREWSGVFATVAASATIALRAILAPRRHCPACGVELPNLGGWGRPRRWCDAHHPRPLRLRPRAPQGAGGPAAPRPRRVRVELPPRDPAQVRPCAPTSARAAR
jgi:hypothetical protein